MPVPTLASINTALGGISSQGVRNLTVRPGENNTFEVHGEADSIGAMQEAFRALKTKLGDATGVMNKIQVVKVTPAASQPASVAAAPSGSQVSPTAPTKRMHVVRKGETLSHIAKHYYGKASDYPKIFDANRDQLNDPDKIREGMTLIIP